MKVGAWIAYPRLTFGEDVFKGIAVLRERRRDNIMRNIVEVTLSARRVLIK